MHNKTLSYLHLPPGADLPALALPPFTAILVADTDVDELWMFDAARWLVACGCRYLLAWGADCEAWRDAIDDAALEAHDYDVPDESKVLSTSHEDEDLEEVFWFARHRAAHPHALLDAVLILHIAEQPARERMMAAYAQA